MEKRVAAELSTDPVFVATEEQDSVESEGEAQEEKGMQKIIHETQKSVVVIETDMAQGSGFLYNDKGDIVTNAHVVDGVNTVRVRFSDSEVHTGTVIGRSNNVDLALVRVDSLEGVEPLPMLENEYLEVGTEVMALGSPNGLENTVTTGIISGRDRDLEIPPYSYEDVYQISAPIAPGSSGGPLVEQTTGKVTAINSAKMTEGDIGFSIPINDVLPQLNEWSENPQTHHETDIQEVPYEKPAVDMDKEAATYVVRHYFDSLNVDDFHSAYNMLSERWRQGETYEKFKSRNDSLGFVEIREVDITMVGDEAKVMLSLVEEEGTEDHWYQATYTVGEENNQHVIVDKEWELVE
ncbi:serine protease [Salibacterium salarium]|uniref:Serine protease n=1 Tax=Salibacterium salarium TaxID=284579 RepID=A0A3R9QP87_9BACI|nr:trypsin-like peptidase domain-containing protein [Salibacterium salarium]RSL35249.1 serine protease [Salibacterium salarium]